MAVPTGPYRFMRKGTISYSDCNARVGSTAAARLAGIALATIATPMSVATTAAIVNGSARLTPNS